MTRPGDRLVAAEADGHRLAGGHTATDLPGGAEAGTQ
jgi:hypothetical protein